MRWIAYESKKTPRCLSQVSARITGHFLGEYCGRVRSGRDLGCGHAIFETLIRHPVERMSRQLDTGSEVHAGDTCLELPEYR